MKIHVSESRNDIFEVAQMMAVPVAVKLSKESALFIGLVEIF